MVKALRASANGSSAKRGRSYRLFRLRTLFKNGKYAEACLEASRLVDHSRQLHISNPRKHAHNLALSLVWRSRLLELVGRLDEANRAFHEAMDTHSLGFSRGVNSSGMLDTATIDQPRRFILPLAIQFNEVWDDEWKARAFPSSMSAEATCRAAVLIRTLNFLHSGPGAYAFRLALALWENGTSAGWCGYYETACEVAAEAVSIIRRLYRIHPDHYRDALVGALQSYGDQLDKCEQLEASRDAYAEVVALTRELYRMHPDQYHDDFAQRLQYYGHSLSKCGHWEAARDAHAEAVELTRGLYRAQPDKYCDVFVRRLDDYGFSLGQCQQLEASRDAYAEVEGLTRARTLSDPS